MMWPSSSEFASKSLFFSTFYCSLLKPSSAFELLLDKGPTFVILSLTPFLELRPMYLAVNLTLTLGCFERLLKGNLGTFACGLFLLHFLPSCYPSWNPCSHTLSTLLLVSLNHSPEIYLPSLFVHNFSLSTTTTTEVRGTVISCLELPQQSPLQSVLFIVAK